MTTTVDVLSEPGRSKKLARQALIMLAEAVIFGIGVEVGKDVYKLIRQRRQEREEEVPPPDDFDDGGGESA